MRPPSSFDHLLDWVFIAWGCLRLICVSHPPEKAPLLRSRKKFWLVSIILLAYGIIGLTYADPAYLVGWSIAAFIKGFKAGYHH
jgi:hypothetical protein